MNIVLNEFCRKTTRLFSKTISTVGRVSDVMVVPVNISYEKVCKISICVQIVFTSHFKLSS